VATSALETPRAGEAVPLATLIEQLLRGLERGSRQWTTARRKDSLQRVIAGSRSDEARLRERLVKLMASWDTETADTRPADFDDEPAPARPAPPVETVDRISVAAVAAPSAWPPIVGELSGTLGEALPQRDASAAEVATALAGWTRRVLADGADAPVAAEAKRICDDARRVLAHREHLVDTLGGLCRELAASLTELAEDDSWARGQCAAMQATIDAGLNARGVRSVGELLRGTRERQAQLRAERDRSREALKAMIKSMIAELGTLGEQTGRFHESVGRHAETIERADSIESLAGAVREMVEESRAVQALVAQTSDRLKSEHARASELSQRVASLEGELKRLSDEVATDPLTQVANRRGLMAAFDAERARAARGAPLAVGLLDIDNFKKLNDSLGHAAGDEALKALAAAIQKQLRPTDRIARFGGEEFVVLLPGIGGDDAQQLLTRLQRALSGSLFMHENRPVFVTFSAGVTAYREGEVLDAALERADQALYEAKRTGKNRTCIA
jgi:diguanylate cyclase